MIVKQQMYRPVARTKKGRGPGRRRELVVRETELGLEQLCDKCNEWWPADGEFFGKRGDGLDCRCRACCKRTTFSAEPEIEVPAPVQDGLELLSAKWFKGRARTVRAGFRAAR